MKEVSESKKDDDYKNKDEEKQKLKQESNPKTDNSNSPVISSIDTNNNVFGKEQQMCVCPFCHMKMFTDVEQEVSWIGIILSVLILLFFKLYGIIFLIIIIKFTQNTIHSCPNCLNKVGVYTVFDALYFQDKVFTLQFSHFGIIVTKKHLFGLLSFVIFGFIFCSIISSISFTKKMLKESWGEFNELCLKSEKQCNIKFMYQEISWTGYVIRVNFNDNFFSRVRVFFLVKMNEDVNNDQTDLVLEVNDRVYNKYKIDIMNITRGDEIAFNATIKQIPSIYRNHVAVAILENIQLTGKNIQINPHVHESGRYGTKGGKFEEGQQMYNDVPNVVTVGKKNLK
jgi:hypothetical protein